MIWMLVLWGVLVGLLLAWLCWRVLRPARATLRTLVVIPFVIAAGLTCYWSFGRNPNTGEWLETYSANRDLVRGMIDGKPDPALDQLPVATVARVLQRELAMQPTAEGWYALSLLYTDMQAPAVSITAARKSVRMAPDEDAPKLLLARSLIAHKDGQLDSEAQSLIEDVLSRQPEHDGAWMMLAMAAMTSGDYDLAVTAFDNLLGRHDSGEAGVQLRKARDEALSQKKNQSWLANLTVTVEAAEGVQPGGTLFVFLRKPGDVGQPLAAVRMLADRFPMSVRVLPGNWLQQPPAPGTALVAGARYATAPGQGVDQAAVTAENQPLSGPDGALSATLRLR